MLFKLTEPIEIQPNSMTALPISGLSDIIRVHQSGWYELWMMVQWDDNKDKGTRFSHTRMVNGDPPIHSEAINADVLTKISGGKQILRGNTIMGPTDGLTLEVWHDCDTPVEVLDAYVQFRFLI